MTLLPLLFSMLAPAFAADIEPVGNPAFDRLFGEIDQIDTILDAAEGRIGRLRRDVAGGLGLPASSSLVATVYTLKTKADGDIRVMNVAGRPIVALGMNAPKQTKDAASTLNEGTQEVATMAQDLGRLPARIDELLDKARSTDGNDDATVQRNLQAGDEVKRRAKDVAERARQVLEDVQKGVDAEEAPAPPTKPAAAKPPPARTVQTLPDVLSKAWVAVKKDDIPGAKRLLDQADLLLPRQTVPVSRGDLIELFQLRAHVNQLTGDATGAAWATAQALVVHPTGEPLSKLGPNYAKLHRAIEKAGIVRKVEVLTTGEGRGYLSGNELGRGSTLQLGQGQHLLQIERDGKWESSVVLVSEGFVVEL